MYTFRRLPELTWAALVAAVAYAGPIIVARDWGDFDSENWERWGAALLAGSARAALGAVASRINIREIVARFTIR